MFWYEDQTRSNDSFKAENKFEGIFMPAAAYCGRTIIIKQKNAFNSGRFKRLKKNKRKSLLVYNYYYHNNLDFVKILIVC